MHWPMACHGLAATRTLPRLCGALWLLSDNSTFENSSIQQNRIPRKPPAQPGRSTQCRLHHTCRTLKKLHLTLKWPIVCLGLATHTLAGLLGLWLPSSTSTSGKLQHSAESHTPQTTCPARPQHSVQALPHLLHTAETKFDLAVAHGMSRAGRSLTGRALCAVVAHKRPHNWKLQHPAKP